MIDKQTQAAQKILESFSEIFQMDICFHDRLNLSKLSTSWQRHTSRPCEDFKGKKNNLARCIGFDQYEMDDILLKNPAARTVTCPAKYSQIVAGVFCGGMFAGVIFVGPFWSESKKPPHPDLPEIKKDIIPAMLVAVDAMSIQMCRHLQRVSTQASDRKEIILRFIQGNLAHKITLANMAKHMNLSPSRTGHVIKEFCGMTFPELLNKLRLQEAARLLTASDCSVGEIARRVGYEEQNYFSRNFKKQYKLSPREYRKRLFKGI